MNSTSAGPRDPKKYWESLSPTEKQRFRKLIGIGSRQKPTDELIKVGRAFDATRKRIVEIEKRALKKLQRGKGNNAT
jgi:DNA-directed RNA polymerase sigma subunit (sigma70/sigma32)